MRSSSRFVAVYAQHVVRGTRGRGGCATLALLVVLCTLGAQPATLELSAMNDDLVAWYIAGVEAGHVHLDDVPVAVRSEILHLWDLGPDAPF